MARRFYLLVVGSDEVLGIEEWLGFHLSGAGLGRLLATGHEEEISQSVS